MPINLKEKTLFVYRDGDADSLALAEYYQSIYNLNNNQIVGINCSDTEILDDYVTFQAEVETPILNAINSASFDVYVVILGLNVPGGFYDDSDIISSTSRISRIQHTFSKFAFSFLYNRQSSNSMIETDFNSALICSRIDAPSLDIAKSLLRYSEEFKNQYYPNGILFVDPFFGSSDSQDLAYQEEVISFYNNLAIELGLDLFSTQSIDPYVDSVVPFLEHDSFYWGWTNTEITDDFFHNTDSARIFFYNAGYDTNATLRSISGGFSPLALSSGYITTAVAFSNPSVAGFLRPDPFFKSLRDGATIGEAYLFSNPYYDSSIGLVGDPLITVYFPDNSIIDEDQIWNNANIGLAKTIAYLQNEKNAAEDIINTVLQSFDVDSHLTLLNPVRDYRRSLTDENIKHRIKPLVDRLFDYVVNDIIKRKNANGENIVGLNEYLESKGFKLSRLFDGFYDNFNSISSANLYEEGFWEFSFVLEDETGEYAAYHFKLEIATDENFENILFSVDSSEDLTGWKYEKEENEFVEIDSMGVPSQYVSRRIKYSSNEFSYLNRGEVYYFRITQKIEETEYSSRISEEVIYT